MEWWLPSAASSEGDGQDLYDVYAGRGIRNKVLGGQMGEKTNLNFRWAYATVKQIEIHIKECDVISSS